MRRLEDGRFVHLHLQSALQLVGLEAHQETRGDRAQGHQHAQDDGEPREPPPGRGLGRTPTHRLSFPVGAVGLIHAEILLQGPLGAEKKTKQAVLLV